MRRFRPRWGIDLRRPLALRDVLRRPAIGLAAQSLLMGAFIVLVFLVMSRVKEAVVAASLASTAFSVFLVPHSRVAQPRSVLLGHLTAVPAGFAGAWLTTHAIVPEAVAFGITVVLVGLALEALAVAHPPAAGTALGLAITPNPFLVPSIVVGVAFLVLAHVTLSRRLLDMNEVRGGWRRRRAREDARTG